ncbi:ferritin family protein [Veillonella sp.]|uniref:ferritin family protein n=1 Tax=Veillonella sp. TaxID=1926307 RepID=UPI0025FF5BEC|nr:ferritin family protein [Veillonella sp.]
MSFYNVTKGTKFEEIFKGGVEAELYGTRVYMTLYLLAKEQGLEDVAAIFHEIAVQEAEHAGFYALCNGEQKPDFWEVAKQIQQLEEQAGDRLDARADDLRAAGLTEAADHMNFIAKQEVNHGKLLKALFEKYGK